MTRELTDDAWLEAELSLLHDESPVSV